ncbi:MAG: DUF6542 domain-containing protein [Mycobacterium sp.]
MPAQRTRTVVVADQRSAHPGIAGVPPWAAVLIAVTATLAGFAVEAGSGHQDLGFLFAACYALGCIAAVLAVRQSGIFTAVIQPPLLLFVAVPLAYFLFHGSSFAGLKDVLITCGYPLIERFPLMLFTSAAVLLIGMARWYLAMGADSSVAEHAAPAAARPSRFAGLATRFASLTRPATGDEPRHGVRRSTAAKASRSSARPRPPRAERPEPPRSRNPRPARDTEYRDVRYDEAGYGVPPRPRRQPARGTADPRERPRRPREGERRTPPPQRREPRDRTRDSRFEAQPDRGYEPYRDRYDYPSEPPRRRRDNGSSTHHPVSRVRYRGSADDPEGRPRR